jgi:hypothetical protein
VDALLHGGQIGVSREEARTELGLTAPAPPPATSEAASSSPPPVRIAEKPELPRIPPRPPEATLRLGVSYEVGAYASNAIEHGPVVGLSLDRTLGRRLFGVMLTGQYRIPIRVTETPVTLRIESGALRVAGVAQLTPSWPLDLRGVVGGGIDVTRADPDLLHIVDARLTPVTRVDAVFRAGILGRLPLMVANRPVLELQLAVDVAPFSRPFAVARGDTQTLLLAPWTVRPLVMLGIALP